MKNIKVLISIVLLSLAATASASKLVSVSIMDKDYIMLYFRDGDVTFNERNLSNWPLYTTNGDQSQNINTLVTYGTALDVSKAAVAGSWIITSTDDPNFGGQGVTPSNVYRKSKLGCMAQMAWKSSDYTYNWAYEHTLFLKLPKSMIQGKTYTLQIPAGINSDVTTKDITFDIFNNRSDAVKVNIVGYSTANTIKSADVYEWMGDGNGRDYSTFVGKNVYIYNTATGESQVVGTLTFWKNKATETSNFILIGSNVWNVDFSGFHTAGNYRLAVEDIGCSDDFTISDNTYYEPFKVSTQGYYYMRVGESNMDVVPIVRHPLFLPGKDPAGCTVQITTMQQYDPNWSKIGSSGDPWDNTSTDATNPNAWAYYVKKDNNGKPLTNPNAWGGHADAEDWDRSIGHVSNIYDMLLPYIVTNGVLSDDNFHIAESGNGIPDIIDEARYEVDYFLRLRDGMGYSHGLNNPNVSNANSPVFYQAGTSAVAAWANAANAAMLGDCFRIAGNTDLMAVYRDSAIVAYNYALSLTNQMLTNTLDVGNMTFTGNDFRITAAAFLYNITGDTKYEDDLNSLSKCKTASSTICNTSSTCELYAAVGYLFTNQTVHYPTLFNNMKSSIISEAKSKEANYSSSRPSRRSTDNNTGWFVTCIFNQRTIVAHALSAAGSTDRTLFENALILEADFSLGRNPMNMINMTTATTGLANKKSPENAYTSGWNDGVPGVHPGHTPYMSPQDWGGTMIMGNPSWMVKNNYPAVTYSGTSPASSSPWPYGEYYYNTRYVYAANEFTPQQTMRGKSALYGYLYAISPAKQPGYVTDPCATPLIQGNPIAASICNGATCTFTLAPPYGGSGAIDYQWEQSADGNTGWTNAEGTSNTQNYTTPALTSSMYYRRVATNATCGFTATSNAALVTVAADLTQRNPSAATITSGNTYTFILVPATGGSGAITYQWQQSADGSTGWTNATGTSNTQNYTTPALTSNMYYRRQATAATCGGTITSNAALVTVTVAGDPCNTPLTQGNPAAASICNGATYTFTLDAATGGSGAITYQWEQSADGNTGWTNATGTSNTQNYTTPALTSSMYYRRTATNATCGSTITSASAQVTVTADFIQPDPSAASINSGDTYTFNLGAATGGSGVITYQWQQSADGSTGWTNATGISNTQNYTTPALTSKMYYRRQATAATCGGTITSNDAIVTVDCPTPAQPGEMTFVPATPITIDLSGTFTATVPNDAGMTYTWSLPTGLTGTSTTNSITITGATEGSYDASAITVTATNSCGNASTASAGSGSISVTSGSGIKNVVSPENTLHIYPVPAKEIIHIQGAPNKSPYTIYDITGMEIASGILSGEEIDISQLSKGIYFIATNNLRGKFIKQ